MTIDYVEFEDGYAINIGVVIPVEDRVEQLENQLSMLCDLVCDLQEELHQLRYDVHGQES